VAEKSHKLAALRPAVREDERAREATPGPFGGDNPAEADRDAAQLALTDVVAFFLDHGIQSEPLVRLLSELAALSAGSSPPAATPHRRPDAPAIEGIKGRPGGIMEFRQQAGLTRKEAAKWVAGSVPSKMTSVGDRETAFPLPHGRGDELHHGSPGIDPRSLPKGPQPRDIHDPYGHIDQIRVKTRDFR
jgi:hypothetical protein